MIKTRFCSAEVPSEPPSPVVPVCSCCVIPRALITLSISQARPFCASYFTALSEAALPDNFIWITENLQTGNKDWTEIDYRFLAHLHCLLMCFSQYTPKNRITGATRLSRISTRISFVVTDSNTAFFRQPTVFPSQST